MTTKNIALNIIANAQGFQKEIAKIPGYTDKSAATAAMKLSTQMEKGFKKTEKQAKKSGSKIGGALTVAAGNMLANLGTMAISAIGNLPAVFAQVTTEAADFTNKINDMSMAVGMSSDTLLGLDLLARASGGTLEKMQSALGGFAKKMTDAAKGTGEAKDAFKNLDIELKNADGSIREANDVFVETADKLAGMEDATIRASTAYEVFGRKGGDIIVAMNSMGMSLLEATAMMKSFGLATDTATESAADFQRLKAVFESFSMGMKVTFMDNIIPLILEFGAIVPLVLRDMGHDFAELSGITVYYASLIADMAQMKLPDFEKAVKLSVGAFVKLRDFTNESTTALHQSLAAIQRVTATTTGLVPVVSGAADGMDDLGESASNASAELDEMKEAQSRSVSIAKQMSDMNISMADGFKKLELQETRATSAALAFVTAGASWSEVAPLVAMIESKYKNLRSELEALNNEAEKTPKLAPGSEWIEASAVAMDRTLAASNAITGAMTAGFQAEIEGITNVANHRQKKIDQRKKQIDSLRASQAGASASEKADIQSEIKALAGKNRRVRRQQKERQKQIRKLWKGQKAASIAEAIMNQSVAIAKAWATLGPIAGPIAVTGLAATLGFEIKRIAQQKAPTFHSGFFGGGAPDESPAVLRRGESVLTQGASNAIGRDGVEALNQGRGSSSTFNFHIGGRLVESLVVDALGGGAAQRTLRPGGIAVGMVNPYVGR